MGLSVGDRADRHRCSRPPLLLRRRLLQDRAARGQASPGCTKLCPTKYWVDEIYHALIVVPPAKCLAAFCGRWSTLLDRLPAVNGRPSWWTRRPPGALPAERQRPALRGGPGDRRGVVSSSGSPASPTRIRDQARRPGEPWARSVTFEARSESKAQAAPRSTSWDFDGDGTWDTKWQQSPNASPSTTRSAIRRTAQDTERVKPRGRWRVNEGTQKLEVAEKLANRRPRAARGGQEAGGAAMWLLTVILALPLVGAIAVALLPETEETAVPAHGHVLRGADLLRLAGSCSLASSLPMAGHAARDRRSPGSSPWASTSTSASTASASGWCC